MPFGMFRSHYSPILADFGSSGVKLVQTTVGDLPTIAAAGVAGYEAVTLYGLYAPAKTPAAAIERLYRDSARFLQTPDIRHKLAGAGVETVGASPQEFAAEIKTDVTRLSKVIKDAGIKAQ